MSGATCARPPENDWARGRRAQMLRALLQRALLLPLLRWLGRPLRVYGADSLDGDGPFVFVANHSSHADTAALLAALPASIRRKTAPAAAADYFFSSRPRGFLVTALTGAFPFPRRGRVGLRRAEALLDRGWSVVLFPEGTRSCDGRVHAFKLGVGELARAGRTIVPVGVAGTDRVLPKGARVPRRSPVAVRFGRPVVFRSDPVAAVHDLQGRVEGLADAVRVDLAQPRARLFDRVASFARSPRALILCFAWGVAEALIFPIVPDFAVVPLALAAPGSALSLALCATAGSVAGGAIAHSVGSTGAGPAIVAHLPLVTDRMNEFAADSIAAGGEGLLRQPLSGVPYKAFAYQAADAGVGVISFLWFSLLARGARILAIAAFFGVAGAIGRWVWERTFGAFLLLFTVCFTIGLVRVVAAWS